MKRFSLILSRKILLTIYESFVWPNLDYADIVYDKLFNKFFKRKIEMVQLKVALVITGAINGTSRDRLYQELGLESFADRRWSRSSIKLYRGSYHLIFKLTIMLFAYLTCSTAQNKIKQIPARAKVIGIHFFCIALRNGVNSKTKLEIQNQSIKYI